MNALQSLVDYGVIGLLLALSVWTVAIAVERWLFYRRVDLGDCRIIKKKKMALTKHLVPVLGIMLTFHTMGTSGTMAVNAIMIGLSLALKATAVGLMVAIPCVVMNNVLRRKVAELLALHKEYHATRH